MNNNRLSRELSKEWKAMMKAHSKPLERGAVAKGVYVKDNGFRTSIKPYRRETAVYQSLETPGYIAAALEKKEYTGDKMLGIGILHKSCLQPIFNEDSAKDIAQMRR